MREKTDHPGVRIPPPLFYAAAVVGGWLLDRWWSLPVGVDSVRPVFASLLLGGFLLLMGSAITSFRRRRTSVLPFRPATTLVIAGPYRYTRNPMVPRGSAAGAGTRILAEHVVADPFTNPDTGDHPALRDWSRGGLHASPLRRRIRRIHSASAPLDLA